MGGKREEQGANVLLDCLFLSPDVAGFLLCFQL